MNLNITPIDKIAEELESIDSFLNITMNEDVQEAVMRGNDLAVKEVHGFVKLLLGLSKCCFQVASETEIL